MITGRQIREARRLLSWTIPRLSARTKAPEHILARAEQINDTSALTLDQIAAIKTALEAAGVEFIPENGGGAGVRLRKQRQP